MISVRRVLLGMAIAFTAYFATRALVWAGPVQLPWLMVASVAVYVLLALLCLFAPARQPATGRGGTPLPRWIALIAVLMAGGLPVLVTVAEGSGNGAGRATWYFGAMGAVLTFITVRRRAAWAWSGLAVLALSSSWAIGPAKALSQGLIGSIVWVATAQLMAWLIDRAYRDTVRYSEARRASHSWQTVQQVRRRERRVRTRHALTVAGPILSRVIATQGELSPEERTAARLAEGQLRDELRGPGLLDDEVRSAIAAARLRGTTVTVLDEGGLDDLPPERVERVRRQLAEAVREADAARLIIRAAPHSDTAVTVVGRSAAGADGDDADSVELWREIPR